MAKAKAINTQDLSDQKKAELIGQEFQEFQRGLIERYGMVLQAQLRASQEAIAAHLVPVKVAPKQPEQTENQPTGSNPEVVKKKVVKKAAKKNGKEA